MTVPRIVKGLELVDDSGDEVRVSGVNEASGVATLKMLEDDDSYTMPLRELRGKLRDGAFAVLEDDDTSDAEDDGDEDEEDDEGDD